jgi:hypothetical protein
MLLGFSNYVYSMVLLNLSYIKGLVGKFIIETFFLLFQPFWKNNFNFPWLGKNVNEVWKKKWNMESVSNQDH